MFLIEWRPIPFERMQRLITDHPDLQAEFALALRALTTELGRAADDWGESRDGPYRLGFVGPLAVVIRIDLDDRLATVVNVGLRTRPESG